MVPTSSLSRLKLRGGMYQSVSDVHPLHGLERMRSHNPMMAVCVGRMRRVKVDVALLFEDVAIRRQ